MSRHVVSLRFLLRFFAIFCDFNGFWLPKRRVWEADFRRNFVLYAKTVILSKCAFRLGGSTIFKVRSVKKSIKNRKKNDAKCDVKNDAQKKRKKSASGWNSDVLGRVLDGPGRPKSVPRAPQDDPKSWERLRRMRFLTLLGALGRLFAFFCDFYRFWVDF